MSCRFGRFDDASFACEFPVDANRSNKSWAVQPSLVHHSFGVRIDTDLSTKLGFNGGFTIGIGFKTYIPDIK